MMRRYRILSRAALLLTALPALSACGDVASFKLASAGILAASHGLFSNPDVNLKEKNYAAADYMASKVQDRIGPYDDIVALPLEESDHAGMTSPMGMQISEGVSLRLIDLGYSVWLSEVAGTSNQGLYAPLPESKSPDFFLKGNYTVKARNVDIALRMVHAKSGKVIGAFDYTMPLTHEIRELAKTQTRIFRVKQK